MQSLIVEPISTRNIPVLPDHAPKRSWLIHLHLVTFSKSVVFGYMLSCLYQNLRIKGNTALFLLSTYACNCPLDDIQLYFIMKAYILNSQHMCICLYDNILIKKKGKSMSIVAYLSSLSRKRRLKITERLFVHSKITISKIFLLILFS